MTTLLDKIIKHIKVQGALNVAEYMSQCLMDPQHGYYQHEKVFGKGGDFITAPEISQMFGEMIGLWLVERWHAMGQPDAFNLIECGPGRGTLMADILRACRPWPAFKDAASVIFVEKSIKLKTHQKKKVPEAIWVDDIASIPTGPSLFIANEFFDALPIHQFIMTKDGWRERKISINETERLCWSTGLAGPARALIPTGFDQCPEGSILEICPSSLSITGIISKHISEYGGAALIVDYGYSESALGDSFQALQDHKFVDPLLSPGKADLTAHVNFEMIGKTGQSTGIATHGPVSQGSFLMSLGIGQRAMQLAANSSQKEQKDILSSLKRLTAADEMGDLFKVIALTDKTQSHIAGF